MGDRGIDLGDGRARKGLTAKPAMVAGRQLVASEPVEEAASTASGPRMVVVLPELWKLWIARAIQPGRRGRAIHMPLVERTRAPTDSTA